MVRPFGDQVGAVSRMPGVEVRFRISPSFAGAVNTSPCASMSARLPVGESSIDWISLFTVRVVGTVLRRSPATRMSTRVLCRLDGIDTVDVPAVLVDHPAGPPLGQSTS